MTAAIYEFQQRRISLDELNKKFEKRQDVCFRGESGDIDSNYTLNSHVGTLVTIGSPSEKLHRNEVYIRVSSNTLATISSVKIKIEEIIGVPLKCVEIN